MRIGELAKKSGIATSKIRFLESQGLVRSSRLPNGYRNYDQESVLTLQIVLQAQSFGFTLEEIRSGFLETQGRGLRCDYIIQRLRGKIRQLDQHIAQVETLRSRIKTAMAEMQTRQRERQAKDHVRVKTHTGNRSGRSETAELPQASGD
jgi:MerR family copper efflux transcriptional regulator